MNQKDKKLVWSLEEALKKQRELGIEGEEIEGKLKIKNIDPNNEVLVYEVKSDNNNKNKKNSNFLHCFNYISMK